MTDLVFTPARKLARLLRTRELSAVELMRATRVGARRPPVVDGQEARA